MARVRRPIEVKFHVTEEERKHIEKKMSQMGMTCMAAYLRKMALDGYIIHFDMPELRELISLLRRSSNNLNQIAKRVNATNRAFETDIQELLHTQDNLWQAANTIIRKITTVAYGMVDT